MGLREAVPGRRANPGVNEQQIFKELRRVLREVGYELFPFLKKPPPPEKP
jgi:hypothetical protein